LTVTCRRFFVTDCSLTSGLTVAHRHRSRVLADLAVTITVVELRPCPEGEDARPVHQLFTSAGNPVRIMPRTDMCENIAKT
jgi:hypothetical protein